MSVWLDRAENSEGTTLGHPLQTDSGVVYDEVQIILVMTYSEDFLCRQTKLLLMFIQVVWAARVVLVFSERHFVFSESGRA